MRKLTQEDLRAIAGPKATLIVTQGVIDSLPLLKQFEINKPWRLAHFLAQIAHESDRFKTTVEYASGAAYEGRANLGNTQYGDGRRFKGRGPIQLTGRSNYRDFTIWCRRYYPTCPDFESEPLKVAEFPWAMLAAVYFWTTRDLNYLADRNNIEMITKRINGGLNGFEDRISLYSRTALVLLDYKLEARVVAKFQAQHGLTIDDEAGPVTRAAMHGALRQIPDAVDVPAIPATRPPVSSPPSEATDPPFLPPATPRPPQSGVWPMLVNLLDSLMRALWRR